MVYLIEVLVIIQYSVLVCHKWEHRKCSGIKGGMYNVIKTFVCRDCVNPVTITNLELVDKFCYLGDMLSVDGDADAAVETRIRTGWNKFRQLVPFHWLTLCTLNIHLLTYLLNEVALQQAEMRVIIWMCGVKLQDRVPGKGMRERLGSDDIISVLQQTGCDGMVMCCEQKTMTG